jgi:hypothetical protein
LVAWPAKYAAKLVGRETASMTAVNTIALAASRTTRRGITVSEVLIMPVPYSEVIVSAPSTTMISSPSITTPVRAGVVALKPIPDWLLLQCDTWPAANRTEKPMPARMNAISVK